MPSSLFGQGPQQSNQILSRVNQLASIAQGNPQALFTSLMQTNPNFAQFVAQNQGKTPEQAFRDAGIDYSQVRNLI